MTTTELIRALRENVAWGYAGDLMLKAADRLEELDERIDIMSEPKCGEDACGITFDGEVGE